MPDYTTNTNTSTSTLEKLLAKTIDVTVNASPLNLFFLSNQKKWAGTQLQIPIKTSQNTNGTWFSGLEKFSTNQTNPFQKMLFNPVGREIPIVISQIEADVNASNPTSNLVTRQIQSDVQDAADDIAGQLVGATATQSGNKFLSLLDGADDGNVTSSYGSLARATYTGLKGTVTSSVGALTTAKMRTQYNAQAHAYLHPDLIVCDKTTWGYYEALLTATVQTTVVQRDLSGYEYFMSDGALKSNQVHIAGNQGFKALTWAGIPVVADDKLPAGYMYFLNKESWSFYGLKSQMEGATTVNFDGPIEGTYSGSKNVSGFTMLKFQAPIDQYAKVAHVILLGNFVCDNSRINGYMSGITS